MMYLDASLLPRLLFLLCFLCCLSPLSSFFSLLHSSRAQQELAYAQKYNNRQRGAQASGPRQLARSGGRGGLGVLGQGMGMGGWVCLQGASGFALGRCQRSRSRSSNRPLSMPAGPPPAAAQQQQQQQQYVAVATAAAARVCACLLPAVGEGGLAAYCFPPQLDLRGKLGPSGVQKSKQASKQAGLRQVNLEAGAAQQAVVQTAESGDGRKQPTLEPTAVGVVRRGRRGGGLAWTANCGESKLAHGARATGCDGEQRFGDLRTVDRGYQCRVTRTIRAIHDTQYIRDTPYIKKGATAGDRAEGSSVWALPPGRGGTGQTGGDVKHMEASTPLKKLLGNRRATSDKAPYKLRRRSWEKRVRCAAPRTGQAGTPKQTEMPAMAHGHPSIGFPGCEWGSLGKAGSTRVRSSIVGWVPKSKHGARSGLRVRKFGFKMGGDSATTRCPTLIGPQAPNLGFTTSTSMGPTSKSKGPHPDARIGALHQAPLRKSATVLARCFTHL
ncbi:hypothetical protein B0T17DRAFT_601903 [Bombardia bombarda]|uniref:Uncharacterized protein n=1 Tax=Bombardia bombarda TaxID=252184 RepID=A0AA39WII4_9PEZI|nr:hypothetical protein B0T17DRAFT_601903 [Bombardia bombarda]